jgi:ABC-type multidrug transport system fused ATPase/permease subunit
MDVIGRAAGAVVALAVVITVLFAESVPLGAVTLVGVPLVLAATAALLRPLHHRQTEQRAAQGALAERAADIVSGLRVLRGIGGERVFSARYREESGRAWQAGVRVAAVESYLRAAQVLLPGLLVAVVTWLGAREAAAGRISIGHLVAFYAYAAFLIAPLWNLYDLADRSVRARVAARRIVRVLDLQPRFEGRPRDEEPAPGGALEDEESGLRVRPGLLTAVAAAVPEEAALIAERLGRWRPGRVTYGGRPLDALPQAWVRRQILVAVNGDALFSGPLREELDPYGGAGEAGLRRALETASATDIVDALDAGLDAEVAGRGREFSGGQVQRLRLARALAADPEVLVLVEPTSAVDAHTEARIAERLRPAREGRTTVVVTTSPLLLDRADRVAYVVDGRVVAEGTHRRLLAASAAYARTVTREEEGVRAGEERR